MQHTATHRSTLQHTHARATHERVHTFKFLPAHTLTLSPPLSFTYILAHYPSSPPPYFAGHETLQHPAFLNQVDAELHKTHTHTHKITNSLSHTHTHTSPSSNTLEIPPKTPPPHTYLQRERQRHSVPRNLPKTAPAHTSTHINTHARVQYMEANACLKIQAVTRGHKARQNAKRERERRRERDREREGLRFDQSQTLASALFESTLQLAATPLQLATTPLPLPATPQQLAATPSHILGAFAIFLFLVVGTKEAIMRAQVCLFAFCVSVRGNCFFILC